ncbi:conserved hypothetical protein [Halorhabdus utahensis DSM 12940]|uniref:Uncharacterized protein n=1 Tax=Halorhabdus utahensis (strain DSM 12940 / JCM 11049 / AX-2) TaxID=519442 RepID=C7NMX6_HALUD|nr:hypothetical protein [Halorhabdus utahensis]ACV12674.1 conserved hypothetical protein [Halorhabdus utahensis DSM 12940]
MSATHTDDMADRQCQQPDDRYAQLILNEDKCIIYDRENYTAWVQSSVAVSPEDYR